MLRQVCFIWLILFITPLSFANGINSFNQSLANDVAYQLQRNSIPGGAYVIVNNGQIAALETFGYTDKAQSRKVNSETVFRLASVSKTFAATVATMLAQEQRLKLSDAVTKYIPKFSLGQKGAAEQIQLRHLLSHSSGLMPNTYDNLLHENWHMEKIIDRFDRLQPICKPAKCYGYQNIAYSFLQPAIEQAQGKNYSTTLQERIFGPLKMNTASVGFEAFNQQANTAKPHILRNKRNTGKKDQQGNVISQYIWRTVDVERDFYKVAPAAGVNASIKDLAKWLIANMGHKPEVLTPELLEELTVPRIKTKKDLRRRYWREHLIDAHYGYGWRIYQFKDYPVIYHSGWEAGFRADIGYSPELDIGFAVLINAESNIINKISSQFWAQAGKLTVAEN
mgnify:FL=1